MNYEIVECEVDNRKRANRAVYQIRRLASPKHIVYVGIASFRNFGNAKRAAEYRFRKHLQEARRNTHYNHELQNLLNSDDIFTVDVIAVLHDTTRSEAEKIEAFYIDEVAQVSSTKLVNSITGGNGWNRRNVTMKQKLKENKNDIYSVDEPIVLWYSKGYHIFTEVCYV